MVKGSHSVGVQIERRNIHITGRGSVNGNSDVNGNMLVQGMVMVMVRVYNNNNNINNNNNNNIMQLYVLLYIKVIFGIIHCIVQVCQAGVNVYRRVGKQYVDTYHTSIRQNVYWIGGPTQCMSNRNTQDRVRVMVCHKDDQGW